MDDCYDNNHRIKIELRTCERVHHDFDKKSTLGKCMRISARYNSADFPQSRVIKYSSPILIEHQSDKYYNVADEIKTVTFAFNYERDVIRFDGTMSKRKPIKSAQT